MTKEKAIKLFHDQKVRVHWNAVKTRLENEGNQLSQNMGQLKMPAHDGKMRMADSK